VSDYGGAVDLAVATPVDTPGAGPNPSPEAQALAGLGGETSLDGVIESLAADGRLIHLQDQPARLARYQSLARPLPDSVAHCLPRGGLWSHQAQAIDLVRDGQSVVVATGTASGKSLSYQLPIAESIVSGLRSGTSLLLYPTKALAQDQLRGLGSLAIPGLKAAT
jgi:DEAD/DEAH box helicase domain-containing protein